MLLTMQFCQFLSSHLRFSTLILFCLCLRISDALVVTKPCCKAFHHIPALFGASIFDEKYLLSEVEIVHPSPNDACSPFFGASMVSKIVLIERGGCNFTTKMIHAQNHGAMAVIVYNHEDSHKWAIAMEADPNTSDLLTIPAVFVAYNTGQYLKAHSDVAVTLNATGHVFQRRLLFGPMETLATYVLVSFALLTCAGGFGLALAVFVTYLHRTYRESAVARLKTVRYSTRIMPSSLSFELVERYKRNIGQFFQASEAYEMLSTMLDSLQASTPELIQAIASRAPDVWPVLQSIVGAESPWHALLAHLQPVALDEASMDGEDDENGGDTELRDDVDEDVDVQRGSEPELTPVPRLRLRRQLSVRPWKDATLHDSAHTSPRGRVNQGVRAPMLKPSLSSSNLQDCRPEFLLELSRQRSEYRRRLEAQGHVESKGSSAQEDESDNWPKLMLRNVSFPSMTALAQKFGEGIGMRIPDLEMFDNTFSTGRVRMSEALQRLMHVYDQFFESVSDTAQSYMHTAMNASNSLARSQMARQLRDGMLSIGNPLHNHFGANFEISACRFKSTICSICLEEFNEGDLLTQLPCDHLYHPTCIGPWLATRSLDCPLCKQPAIPQAQVEVFERLFGDIFHALARQWQVLIIVFMSLVMAALCALWVLAEVSKEDSGYTNP